MDEQITMPIMGRVTPLPLVEEIKHSYLDYAMSVIVGRALPDARDGLKPVQRRILYSMMGLGIKHNQSYKKSARVVGETMGKYHPHGDSAIYDTMVRMAQDFSMRYQLIDGQGNFGSIDGDGAAAMRYTEARFKELGELMLADIDEDTVDWGPNFDESLTEPMVLPSQVPNLLINGSTGIAVGMATNIPPHNLTEVTNALCYILDNPDKEIELAEIMNFITGPDFPTGGMIMGRDGIIDAYSTGRGKVIMRGRCHTEDGKKGRSSVIITEIPYMVNKTTLIENIVKCVQTGTIDGVHDVRDESDRDGLRIVMELSKDGDPDLVQRQLYNRTQLQSTFGVINLALVNARPLELTLVQMLNLFLEHRRTVITRRTQFRLNKAQAREHIIEGLCKALDVIDQIIALIKAAQSPEEARNQLIDRFSFSEIQAQAILDMRLQRLTGLERDKLISELAELVATIASYKAILNDSKVLDKVIKEELEFIRKKFGDARRTEISLAPVDESTVEDLLPEEQIVVMLSQDGFLRRTSMQNYNVQARGGKGRRGANLRESDEVALMDVTTTHNDVYFFTSKGRVFALKGYVVPETKAGKGKHISKILQLEENERVVAIKGGSFTDEGRSLFFITVNGIAKRMEASEQKKITKAGKRVLTLDEGDEIAQVRTTTGDNQLLLVTRSGKALKVDESEFRVMGRGARGVKAMKLQSGDSIISCDVIEPDRTMLFISETGIGKRTSFEEFSLHHRATGGMKAMNLGSRTGNLVAAMGVSEDDDIVVITAKGRMIRLNVSEVPLLSRQAAGSIVVRLDEGDSIADCSVFEVKDEV